MNAVVPLKKKPRRWWRWLLRGMLGLMVLIALGLVSLWLRLLWEQRQGRAELAAVIAELEESDPRWRWEEIEADLPDIPDEENSAVVVRRVVESFGKWQPSELKTADGAVLTHGNTDLGNRRFDEQRLKAIRDELSQHEKSVELALSLKDYPSGRTSIVLSDDLVNRPLPHASNTREVAHLLRLDCERQWHNGSNAAIPDRIRAILNTGASMRHDPSLTYALIRVALRAIAVGQTVRALAMGELSDDALRGVMMMLEAERKENWLLLALRADRAEGHRLYVNLETGKIPLAKLNNAVLGAGQIENLDARTYSFRLADDHVCYLRRFSRILGIAGLPSEQQTEATERFDTELKAEIEADREQKRRLVANLLIPGIHLLARPTIRDRANLSCAIAGLACERYRLKHKRWPKALDELVPAFLDKVPLDSFTGKPVRLAVRENGIVVYSIGADGVDHGGPGGAAHDFRFCDDFGFRLYDADKRNLPPEPARQDDP